MNSGKNRNVISVLEKRVKVPTWTVLSRTTWETVSRSCAAIPGLPSARVNFLSLIFANDTGKSLHFVMGSHFKNV